MNKVLLVEGAVDDAFFDSLFRKLGKGEGIEVKVGRGVPENALKLLLGRVFAKLG